MTQHESTTTVLRKNKKVLIASLTGSSIEWFDYFLYGTAAALVFNKIFFPMVDPVIGLILSYLSFSLTFFIRPIGGVLFAHIGDRIGRKKNAGADAVINGRCNRHDRPAPHLRHDWHVGTRPADPDAHHSGHGHWR